MNENQSAALRISEKGSVADEQFILRIGTKSSAETANRPAAVRRVAARQGELRFAKTEYRFLESG